MSSFRFRVDKVFSVRGRGTVVSGRIEEGKIAVEQVVGFLEPTGQWKNAVVVAIELEQRLVEEAQAGQQASLLLEGVKRNQIPIGTVLLEPPHGPVSRKADQMEREPEPAVRAPSPAAPKIPHPAQGPTPRPIQPASGSWGLLILLLGGVLIILLLLFSQGKLDPLKRRVEVHPDRVETMTRFVPPGKDFRQMNFNFSLRVFCTHIDTFL